MCRKHTSVDRSRDSLGMFFAGITKTQAHVCSLHVSSPKARWHRHFVTHRWKQTALLAVLSQQWREKLVHTHTHTQFSFTVSFSSSCVKNTIQYQLYLFVHPARKLCLLKVYYMRNRDGFTEIQQWRESSQILVHLEEKEQGKRKMRFFLVGWS